MKAILLLLMIPFFFTEANICEEIYLYNRYPQEFMSEFDDVIPGQFLYHEKETTDGFFYFERFQRVEEGHVLGEIYFRYTEATRKLFISDLHVTQKKNRIGSLLVSRMLLRYPQTRGIRTNLGLDNFREFIRHKDLGFSDIEALKLTPAYKMRKKFGFGKIKEESIDIDYEDSSGSSPNSM